MNNKSSEYIIKAKNIEIEYEISKGFDFRLLITPIIWVVIGLIIFIWTYFTKTELILWRLIVAVLGISLIMVIHDWRLWLKKIKLANGIMFIQKMNKEYKFKNEDLTRIRVGFDVKGWNIFSKPALFIT